MHPLNDMFWWDIWEVKDENKWILLYPYVLTRSSDIDWATILILHSNKSNLVLSSRLISEFSYGHVALFGLLSWKTKRWFLSSLWLLVWMLICYWICCFFKYLQYDAQEAVKKRRRATKKPYSRSIVGATLEVIQKRRTEKPEVQDAAREAALQWAINYFF